jgi:hypothetical protein
MPKNDPGRNRRSRWSNAYLAGVAALVVGVAFATIGLLRACGSSTAGPRSIAGGSVAQDAADAGQPAPGASAGAAADVTAEGAAAAHDNPSPEEMKRRGYLPAGDIEQPPRPNATRLPPQAPPPPNPDAQPASMTNRVDGTRGPRPVPGLGK